jgi:hypothetical protein
VKTFQVELHIPAQDVEVEVIALNAGEALRIALRDVQPLDVSHVSTSLGWMP